MESCFFRTCEYLSLCSNAGIIFNEKKFQFGQEEVDFLGFRIGMQSIKPCPEYLQAIKEFPRPKDITGIRSWFGLVQQVAYAFSDSEIMLPFRNLLKPSTEFVWTQELQDSFDASKTQIIQAVEAGVRIYDPKKTTALCTDWSKTGIGFVLLQKDCECTETTPVCCKVGWTLVYAGSRFTNGAESRYAPIEGECMAAAWALNKTKYFTLGCRDLILGVDHKPLLSILGDKNLQDIENPRLLHFKEKTLRFSFECVHVPGKLNLGADFGSRNPTQEEQEEAMMVEQKTMGKVMSSVAGLSVDDNRVRAITMERICQASATDKTIKAMIELVRQGCHEVKDLWPEELQIFYPYREHLSSMGEILLFKNRVVVPHSLRKEILDTLHSGHQGVTAMVAIASQAVFWPGMNGAIAGRRAACASCDRVAPSQSAAPPWPLPQPSYPFQMIASDYFSFAGRSYYIIVDRYSGWLSIYKAEDQGASELVRTLKEYFSTFGIASEMTSDGGPQYASSQVRDFLKDWGVSHRTSSSYFPHSNQRAEQGVKSAKRMLRDNIATDGTLRQDRFLRALMLHRNTPDRDTGLSPSQMIFGRAIKDFFTIQEGNLRLHPEWRLTMEQRELALARRHARREADLSEHTKQLRPLEVGQVVMVQNQTGNNPRRWDKSGVVVEVMPFDKYKIKIDGTGRITTRNRRFLKPIRPVSGESQQCTDGSEEETGVENKTSGGTDLDQDLGESSGLATRTTYGRLSRPPERLEVSVLTGSRSSRWGRA